jgi:hypothetical protein
MVTHWDREPLWLCDCEPVWYGCPPWHERGPAHAADCPHGYDVADAPRGCICDHGYVPDADHPRRIDVEHTHDGDCPRTFDHIEDEEGIAAIRRYLMDCSAEGTTDVDVTALARGITARAVELGVEKP